VSNAALRSVAAIDTNAMKIVAVIPVGEVPKRINTLVNGKRGVTAETAILLAEVLDTTPEFWMGLQASFDLWHALRRREKKKALAAARLAALGATEPRLSAPRRRRSRGAA